MRYQIPQRTICCDKNNKDFWVKCDACASRNQEWFISHFLRSVPYNHFGSSNVISSNSVHVTGPQYEIPKYATE